MLDTSYQQPSSGLNSSYNENVKRAPVKSPDTLAKTMPPKRKQVPKSSNSPSKLNNSVNLGNLAKNSNPGNVLFTPIRSKLLSKQNSESSESRSPVKKRTAASGKAKLVKTKKDDKL